MDINFSAAFDEPQETVSERLAREAREGVARALAGHAEIVAAKKAKGERVKSGSLAEFLTIGDVQRKRQDFNDRAKTYLGKTFDHWHRVDYFDTRTNRSRDFLGIFDYVCFNPNDTVGVQITSVSQMSVRRRKILESQEYDQVKRAGWRVLLLGFPQKGQPVSQWL
jgi:hypothetical protein